MPKSSEQSPARLGYRLTFVAMRVLEDNDGSMSIKDLREEIHLREKDKIPDTAKERYNDNNQIKWHTYMGFMSVEFVKADFIRKEKGVWYLTAEGKKVLPEGEAAVCRKARKAYHEWNEKRKQKKEEHTISPEEDEDNIDSSPEEGIDEYQSKALSEIEGYIRSLEAYEFQDLCAALLRGMGYHVRDIASPGPDGGIDILAYTDALGGSTPRLKVQVKHTTKKLGEASKTGRADISQLAGLLTEGDIGVFISSRGFASGCRDTARNHHRHLELIDSPRFIELWKEHYDKLSEEDKSLLPLLPIYFLDTGRTAEK